MTLNARLEHCEPAPTEMIQKIIETCDADPYLHPVRDIIRVIANTGLWNSEFSALRISNVDCNRKWLFAVQGRAFKCAHRALPLQGKTLHSLMSLHAMNHESVFVLGDHPTRRFKFVVKRLQSMFPDLSRGRLIMHPVRMNFVSRLYSAGIPLSIVNYCMGRHNRTMLMAKLSLTNEEKLEILRRNIEKFLPEL